MTLTLMRRFRTMIASLKASHQCIVDPAALPLEALDLCSTRRRLTSQP